MVRSLNDNCAKLNMCQLHESEGTALACPVIRTSRDAERYFGGSNLVLPERLYVEALMRHPQVSANKDPFKQQLNDSYYNLEVALAHPDEDQRKSHFKIFCELNEAMINQPDIYSKGRPGYFIQAQILNMHLPALAARVDGRLPTLEEITLVHKATSIWSEGFRDNILSRIPKNNHAERKLASHFETEVDVERLLTRLNDPYVFPWVALPREEASSRRSEFNHDRYFIDESGNKIPIQIKNNKRPGGYTGVPVITMQGILSAAKEAAKTLDYTWCDESRGSERHSSRYPIVPPLVPSIKQLLGEELDSGRNMNTYHRNLLNCASMHVLALTRQYEPAG